MTPYGEKGRVKKQDGGSLGTLQDRAGAHAHVRRLAGSGGISRNELTRKTQFIRKTFRDEYLADLVESGELVMTTGSHGLETYKMGI